MHDRRRLLKPAVENRNGLTLTLALAIAGLLVAFLYSMAWSRQNAGTYLAGRPNIIYLKDAKWRVSDFQRRDCYSGMACYDAMYGQSGPVHVIDFNRDAIAVPEKLREKNQTSLVLFQFTLSPNAWQRLADFPSLVLSLPKFEYRRADLFISGIHRGTFFASGRVTVEFEPGSTGFNPEQVDLLLEVSDASTYITAVSLPGLNLLEKSVAVMTLAEDREYVEFITTDRAARGNFIGVIARIVMAMFVLSLFLIIDGSPETLGLGISLGLEAFASTLSFGWLPITHPEGLSELALHLSDVFRLYFFLQLARMVDKSIGPWLIFGVLTYALSFLNLNFLTIGTDLQLGVGRDAAVGLLGIIICLRAAWDLKNKEIPWRVAALIVGSVAGVEQAFQPLLSFFQVLRKSNGYNLLLQS